MKIKHVEIGRLITVHNYTNYDEIINVGMIQQIIKHPEIIDREIHVKFIMEPKIIRYNEQRLLSLLNRNQAFKYV